MYLQICVHKKRTRASRPNNSVIICVPDSVGGGVVSARIRFPLASPQNLFRQRFQIGACKVARTQEQQNTILAVNGF